MTLEEKKELIKQLQKEITHEEEMIILNEKKEHDSKIKMSYNNKITLDFSIFSMAFYKSLSKTKKNMITTDVFSLYKIHNNFFKLGEYLFQIRNDCRVYNIEEFIKSKPLDLNENFYNKFEKIIKDYL